MEIDVKTETKKVQQELAALNQQLAQIQQQLANWQNQNNNMTAMILKKSGELELLNRLDGKKGKVEKNP